MPEVHQQSRHGNLSQRSGHGDQADERNSRDPANTTASKAGADHLVADVVAYERFHTTKLLVLPGVSRTISHQTMKLIKREL